MASKKAGGSTRNGRDSQSKRLGIKVYGGEQVVAGNIIVRQRGTNFFPGSIVPISTFFSPMALLNGPGYLLYTVVLPVVASTLVQN